MKESEKLTEFGAFVGLEESSMCLIHISDMSWTKHINIPRNSFKRARG